jgi:hypothetical protein
MEKISWTDCVENEEVLSRVREEANWIVHILHRNCLLNHVIERMMEGRIEVTGRRE